MAATGRIRTVESFLAHALSLELVSVDRYQELAETMTRHGNAEVAGLFQKLAGLGRLHAREVEQRAAGRRLPDLRPWEFKWQGEAPTVQDLRVIEHRMQILQALYYALDNERRGRDFYAEIARDAPNPEVRAIAADFASEEDGHVKILERWIRESSGQEDESAG